DSLAFGAAARHVYGAIDDSDNGRKLLVRAKNNLACRDSAGTLAYRFNSKTVGHDPDKGNVPIIAPYVEFDSGYVDVTATEAMHAANEFKSKRAAASPTTMPRSSCFTSPSGMPECAGGEVPSGRPPWASLRFSSAHVFRDRRDDPAAQSGMKT